MSQMVELKKAVFKKGDRFLILEVGKPIKELIGGMLIKCKICGKYEAVNEGSFCDRWSLCVEHARVKLKERGIVKC